MIKILNFNKNHIDQAKKIALMNYNEEKSIVATLPRIKEIPDLKGFAENGLGVAAFSGSEMVGFLCCFKPWENAFDSAATGTFSPVHAHGAVLENRSAIYKRLYREAARKWIENKITYHAIALYAHDVQAVNTFFSYGFGLRCLDAVRPMINFEYKPCDGISFDEIPKTEFIKVREMRKLLKEHMRKSPCFMYSPESAQNWLIRAEKRNSRLFVAMKGQEPVAYIEITDNGENFATDQRDMQNICGAFCYPEYRGKDIVQGLLNYVISKLKVEGFNSLGVDFEGFNPNASGFWLKYFIAYTNSVVRRIDECALILH